MRVIVLYVLVFKTMVSIPLFLSTVSRPGRHVALGGIYIAAKSSHRPVIKVFFFLKVLAANIKTMIFYCDKEL